MFPSLLQISQFSSIFERNNSNNNESVDIKTVKVESHFLLITTRKTWKLQKVIVNLTKKFIYKNKILLGNLLKIICKKTLKLIES